MKLALIAAVADNNAIGINNKMPWYLPGDLRYFKAVTMGKPIIMGRKTFDSLKKPLPGRTNIVITRDKDWHHDGVKVVHCLADAIALAEDIALINGNEEVMVIGGEQIYRLAIEQADRLYLTRVYQSFDGDAFFPEIAQQQWRETSREDIQPEHDQPLTYSYLVLDRA
ncbi:dihydrofolate reductase [Endozoicomonas elysicola]|uniref:Dihydrofolate reductase n=1 Tax=Endozoicomonas elysicola TaxID=305900 RepID=A0A081K7D1_9GAMM|nr:dihydrofolate reductase [Endozoicomonas elysicola]KEI70057.1 dihydrofolate reductase [Endozoicomonas elysicola]